MVLQLKLKALIMDVIHMIEVRYILMTIEKLAQILAVIFVTHAHRRRYIHRHRCRHRHTDADNDTFFLLDCPNDASFFPSERSVLGIALISHDSHEFSHDSYTYIASLVGQVVDYLLVSETKSSGDWAWQKQLRYYVPSETSTVMRMCDAQFNYTFEYQGNAPKLVHTPLTDKCYLTLTQVCGNGQHIAYYFSSHFELARHIQHGCFDCIACCLVAVIVVSLN
jgi:hypothetical protein